MRSSSARSCETRFACGPTGSWSARCVVREALDMLQAMNTGHDGSLTTVHASSPADALRRIETMVLMAGLELPHSAAREQVSAAVDVVVHVSRAADGRRFVRSLDGQDRAAGELRRLDAELVERLRKLRCGSLTAPVTGPARAGGGRPDAPGGGGAGGARTCRSHAGAGDRRRGGGHARAGAVGARRCGSGDQAGHAADRGAGPAARRHGRVGAGVGGLSSAARRRRPGDPPRRPGGGAGRARCPAPGGRGGDGAGAGDGAHGGRDAARVGAGCWR